MRPFSQVDVFADELTAGNPVAVVHEAEGLTDAQMAAVASWTNLSETTFLLPPTDPTADYRLRIFTPRTELPFAGHPTLGSARAWLEAGGVPRDGSGPVQECGAGLVRLRSDGGRLAFAAPPLRRSGPVDDADVSSLAAALGVPRVEVRDAAWVDNGPGWVALLLADAATVLGLEPDLRALAANGVSSAAGVVGPHPAGGDVAFEVRAFVPAMGVGEDPVTGSLNAGLGRWLVDAGHAPTSYVAAQGTRLGRRGRVHVEHADGEVWVGGGTVPGVVGTLAL
ncbi:PhzF family phenazine biosynthesis protein [Actinomycetospora sp. TBRC 11914]|uniref:PhzF family phenazine biosynthesis protein n=1 Tax=Actinomycetospora sp. TBRC 11914 TaxID=2729387 RepID=UPI00145C4A3D|nr:PhzF family phenazine biosynthesis protein [Actinomycetospora sp. TBRC 11914]NMO89292.1 PhzF family phenazine biosynthesis protein [Actinomycetospora sp. TBRC 11914]